jgi:dihydroorotate dehydrogenase
MKKAIIAAPFGSYISLPRATSTRGTYTYRKRKGAILGALTRINFTSDGIYNRMGMKNPGIQSQDFSKHKDVIWSIGAEDMPGFLKVIYATPKDTVVELNMSCPNINNSYYHGDIKTICSVANDRFKTVIIKLPPDFKKAAHISMIAYFQGITKFTCCNTIKTDKGGLSGREIQKYSLPIIEYLKRNSDIECISSGGIYSKDDVKRYRNSGADYFSLATILMLYPWRVAGVINEIYR